MPKLHAGSVWIGVVIASTGMLLGLLVLYVLLTSFHS